VAMRLQRLVYRQLMYVERTGDVKVPA
jgi:hypothetical protein